MARRRRSPSNTVKIGKELPDSLLVTDSSSSDLYVSDPDEPTNRPLRLSQHKGRITLLSDCLKGKLVSADAYGRVCVWDFHRRTPDVIELIGHNGPVKFVAATPQKRLLTVDAEGNVRAWDLEHPGFLPPMLPRPEPRVAPNPVSPKKGGRPASAKLGDAVVISQTPDLDGLYSLARDAAARNFTYKEWTRYFAGTTYRPTFSDLPIPRE